MPNGLGTRLSPPLKVARRNSAPHGVPVSPLLGPGSARGGVSQNSNNGADDHCNPDGGEIKEGIEGGEDECPNFKRALYVAQIAPPMPPRGRQRKVVD
jgi:hypothetical protein